MATSALNSTYGRVLGLPGALTFSISGLVARMPMSMISLAIVLLISTRDGSYALAGSVSAAFLVANASCSVPQARLIDRFGQSRVLPVAALVFASALTALILVVALDQKGPWLHLAAAIAGAALPQIGSSIRARWSHVIEDKRDLHTAYSFESVVDELIFITGPVTVTLLATVVHPYAGLVCAVLATVAGTAMLVSQKSTEPPARPASRTVDREPMPWRMLAPLMVCASILGAMLGSAEVATVGFSDERGATPLSGLMLAIWAGGSLVSGIVTGAIRPQASNAFRFRWSIAALAALVVPLPFVHGFLLLAACLFVSGFAISPTLIASFAWIEEAVPSGRVTEGIALFTTSVGAGLAPGAALAGLAVDRSGASSSFWVVVVTGVLGAAVAHTCAERGPRVPRVASAIDAA